MQIRILGVALILSGCVTTSDVVPMGDNQFMLTGHASGGLNAGKGTAAAAEKAAAYCAQSNRSMLIVNSDFHGAAAIGGESTSLVFRCASK